MRVQTIAILLVAASIQSSCERGGTSTREMRVAAIEKARQDLALPPNAPLEATVWVGQDEYKGQPVVCGTVSDTTPGSRVRPQRFAATPDPVEWLIFEDAHGPTHRARPDMFVEWGRTCGAARPS